MKVIQAAGIVFGGAIALTPLVGAQMTQMPTQEGSTAGQAQSSGMATSVNPLDSNMNGVAGTDTQLMKDKMFVHRITEDELAENRVSQLAAQKSSNDEVKKLAQNLVADDSALATNMKPVADELGVSIPTKMAKPDQEEFDKLNALSGTDFDKEYLAYSLRTHRKDLHDFHNEANVVSDPQLKDATASLEKMIAGHLILVNQLALANNVPGAHHPGTPGEHGPPQ